MIKKMTSHYERSTLKKDNFLGITVQTIPFSIWLLRVSLNQSLLFTKHIERVISSLKLKTCKMVQYKNYFTLQKEKKNVFLTGLSILQPIS